MIARSPRHAHGRAPSTEVAALLADTRLLTLTGPAPGSRDLPHRQRTLSATIEWSYELLTEEQRQL